MTMFSEPLVGPGVGDERYPAPERGAEYQGYAHMEKQRNYQNQEPEDREVQ